MHKMLIQAVAKYVEATALPVDETKRNTQYWTPNSLVIVNPVLMINCSLASNPQDIPTILHTFLKLYTLLLRNGTLIVR